MGFGKRQEIQGKRFEYTSYAWNSQNILKMKEKLPQVKPK